MHDQCVVGLILGTFQVIETTYVGVVSRSDLERLARDGVREEALAWLQSP